MSKVTDTTSELDCIQSLIWARVHDELVKEGVNLTIGQAYSCGAVIKEVLHPRVEALIDKVQTEARNVSKVNRLEVIDSTGRAYVKGSIYGTPVKVELSMQDDNRTLKVFVEELNQSKEKK